MMYLPGLAQSIVALDIGLRLLGQAQRLRRIHDRRLDRLAVDQPVQEIEDVDLGRNAALQRHLDGGQHDLLVMLQDERQDLDHLAVAAGLPEQVLLQPFEGFGEFSKGSAVAQSTGLALDDRQIVTPVVDGATGAVMRPLDDAGMLAYDMPLRGNHDPFWIDPEADWPIGEGRRHAVAIALQMDQAG